MTLSFITRPPIASSSARQASNTVPVSRTVKDSDQRISRLSLRQVDSIHLHLHLRQWLPPSSLVLTERSSLRPAAHGTWRRQEQKNLPRVRSFVFFLPRMAPSVKAVILEPNSPVRDRVYPPLSDPLTPINLPVQVWRIFHQPATFTPCLPARNFVSKPLQSFHFRPLLSLAGPEIRHLTSGTTPSTPLDCHPFSGILQSSTQSGVYPLSFNLCCPIIRIQSRFPDLCPSCCVLIPTARLSAYIPPTSLSWYSPVPALAASWSGQSSPCVFRLPEVCPVPITADPHSDLYRSYGATRLASATAAPWPSCNLTRHSGLLL